MIVSTVRREQYRIMLCAKTYHYSHAGTLYYSAKGQYASCNLPSRCSSLYATTDDYYEGYEGAEFHDDAEGNKKANCSPHIAKSMICFTVRVAREGNTDTCDGRAAAVQAIRVLAFAILELLVRRQTEDGEHLDVRTGL